MSSTLHFLPWLRRGLGLTLSNVDPGTGELPRGAPIEASVELEDDTVEAVLSLRPVDHATGIDTAQVIRRYPAAGSVDAEYGYFPLADIAAADLPWVLTPAAPDPETSRLRPWVTLVCVEDDGAELVVAADGRPARLLVADVGQLPDLDESHAWAHVQSTVGPGRVVSSLADDPGAVIARLICPRRLEPDTAYRVAIVAAFRVDGDGDGEDVIPAWSPSDPSADLVVYDTWTIRTGQAGSFEELCERLGPVDDPNLVLGLKATDVTELGPVDPWPEGTRRVVVDYAGALWDADVEPAGLGRLADDFAGPVAELLDRADLHVELDLDEPDPVVTPPFVGSWAAGAESVPRSGWLPELNLDPANRAAAGLGAEVVRIHQERFMASAWKQVGELRETNRQLSITRLQAEVARTWKARADRLDAHQRVAVMRSQLTFVRDDAGDSPRRALAESTFPSALASPAYLRVSRPGAVVATAAARRNPEGWTWHSALGDVFGSPELRDLMAFAVHPAPDGTRFADTRGTLDDSLEPDPDEDGPIDPDEPTDPDGPLPTRRDGRDGRDGPNSPERVRPSEPGDLDPTIPDPIEFPIPETSTDTFDLGAAARLVTERIAPIESARRRIEARISGLVDAFANTPADELPTRVAVGPVIDEALVWALGEMSPELLLPGVDRFPLNSVRVVETNTAFVAAFLGGANHEMNRELLWREFPADLGSTTFRRFWDRPDMAVLDIDPIAEWPRGDGLAELGATGSQTVVVLVRGDLVRHYPTVRVLLVDPATNIASLPTFGGWIPPDVRFMAFDVESADAVTAPNSAWSVVFEEQPSEPRFGLDTLAEGDDLPRLTTWNQLSWDHLTPQGSHLVIDGALVGRTTFDGATWGLNAAHMARATYQAPYRRTFPVDELIGGS